MSSTPVTILEFRSGQSSDRPFTESISQGQFALSFGAAEPGLYFLDSANSIRKIGPAQYGANPPNSNPQGSAGNSVGELWVDNTAASYMHVWTGSQWKKVGAGFVETADEANQCLGQIATTFTGGLPAVGPAGSAAFDTSAGKLYMSNGSAWVAIN